MKYPSGKILLTAIALFLLFGTTAKGNLWMQQPLPNDTTPPDSTDMPYPFGDLDNNPYSNPFSSPLFLDKPSNINTDIYFNPETNDYELQQNIGDLNYRNPFSMSPDEYRSYDFERSMQNYWRQRYQEGYTSAQQESDPFSEFLNPQLNVDIAGFNKIFGSNTIDIKPQGSAELIFGLNISKVENPALPRNLQNHVTFDFDEKIRMNVRGQIGEKVNLGISYDTEATFDFENETKLGYEGGEDEIIQKIEAGNVSLPLSGSLITGSHSLFGVKTELKFGKLRMTSILSQQKSETSTIQIQGGAQTRDFKVFADDYEANKHFFLAHYFRENYTRALEDLPIIASGVKITRAEVWITNKSANFENSRNIVAFMDLAEPTRHMHAPDVFYQNYNSPYPDDSLNTLYNDMVSTGNGIRQIQNVTTTLQGFAPGFDIGDDYEKIENARKLEPSEYSINSELGYISLNRTLKADEVLAVAFEYTINGELHQVGEFSSDLSAPKTLILKLLKGTGNSPQLPTWDLMMKNIYSIDGYQISKDNFQMNIMYQNDRTGAAINYLPEGDIKNEILLRVLNLDDLNNQLDPQPNGQFDFVNGVTIDASSGRIIFPMLEPFGEYIRKAIGDDRIADKYTFPELYDSTQTKARQLSEKNKFFLEGTFQSSTGSEIPLNAMNIPEGSVNVTASGMQLQEGQDYTVDYTLGRVSILNQSLLESGTPIKVSLENNSMFNTQTKTMVGTHLDYKVNDNLQFGGTVLHLNEKPLTKKVSFGDEPISNTIWGVNGSYSTRAPFLTKMVDKIPFIDTKAESRITVSGEFAHLIPGHSKAIKKKGVSYIDDFEGTQTTIDLKTPSAWSISSTPQKQESLFPEGEYTNSLKYGFNRAKIAWYNVNSDFQEQTSATPDHLNKDDMTNHFVRRVYETDLFPNKESESGLPTPMSVLNLAFYPREKGPYNYDAEGSEVSAGMNEDGELQQPKTRWGGIMRELQTNDFESANVEFIEFWMMDPFVYDSAKAGGDLYFNLGNISEDVLRDARKAFEQGLPTTAELTDVDTTVWGRVPLVQSLVNAFDNNPGSRQYQDVGMDGLNTNDEKLFYSDYLNTVRELFGVNSEAYQAASTDPANDNYHFFKGSDYDDQNVPILERYKKYNGLEGNSPTSGQSPEPYPTSGSLLPDMEDINKDHTLNETESYYQYKISLRPEDLQVGKNYITDKIVDKKKRLNNETSEVNWYQFKIPVSQPDDRIGNIQDFKSIRFIRMFMRNFSQEVVLRFAKLHLVRSEWRRYRFDLREGGETTTFPQKANATFDISAVNIEENGTRTPINYVLPPGIDRVIDPQNPQMRQLNEQAMILNLSELEDGDARGAYRNMDLDMRQYRRLRMFLHAEAVQDKILNDDDLSVFIRIGSDIKENYYEYEIPLTVTGPGLYNNNSSQDRREVWPKENELNLKLEKLIDAKLRRNREMLDPESRVRLTSIYELPDGNNTIRVVGSPTLSNVRTIMIGVRNPKQENNPRPDDGMQKSGEIWINELRLTDFKDNGGWAANTRVKTQLADFANLTFAGSTSKPGFGSIEKKVNERQKEEINQFDFSSNIHLDKFFPERFGVRLPLYVGYSRSVSNPQYNPLEPDVELDKSLQTAPSDAFRDSIKNIAQDFKERKSINLTNVRVTNPTGSENRPQPKIYSLSNWSMSYAYNEIFARNINTQFDVTKKYSGNIAYNFSNNPQNVNLFQNVDAFDNKVLRILKDANFYYAPRQITFSTDMNRTYREMQLRNISNPDIKIDPTFQKDFQWRRNYGIKYDLTKAIKLNFSATAQARIDEPDGRIAPGGNDYYTKRDTIFRRILNGGRTTNYKHRLNASWRLPINKLPLLDWTSANLKYTGNYTWNVGPKTDTDIELGNVISNNQNIQLNSQLNFNNLYNKVNLLKRINREYGRAGAKPAQEKEKVTYNQDGYSLEANTPVIFRHKLKTEDVTVKVSQKGGGNVQGRVQVIDENSVRFVPQSEADNAVVNITGQRVVKENIFKRIAKRLLYTAMGVKNVSISFSENNGTVLPGYMPTSDIIGLTRQNDQFAPGVPFVFGMQDNNFARQAALNSWLTTDTLMNSAYKMTHNSNLNFRASVQPLPNLRIDVNAKRSVSDNMQEYWGAINGSYTDNQGRLIASGQNTMHKGNFNISYNIIKTSFWGLSDDYQSQAYENFKKYRGEIAWRLARQRTSPDYDPNAPNIDPETGEPVENGFPNGYSPLSQEVMLPAFLAAYSDRPPGNVKLDPFPTLPLPNWRITYDGLAKIEPLKRWFNSVNLTHSYRSIYRVGSYTSNPRYNYSSDTRDGMSYVRDNLSNRFLPEHQLSNVAISEEFSPLIGIDLSMKNSLTSNLEFRKTRNLALSFSNNQLVEAHSYELLVGAGYRLKQLPLIINENRLQSDLNMRADVSIKDMRTVVRKLEEGTNQLTSGQRNITIKFTADYVLSERFNLRIFYDQVVNQPKVSTAYPSSNTKVGVSIRVTLIP